MAVTDSVVFAHPHGNIRPMSAEEQKAYEQEFRRRVRALSARAS
jgi:hypothetical protein